MKYLFYYAIVEKGFVLRISSNKKRFSVRSEVVR